jgi:uncharacterized membrane protein YoaK (UPF0700 family)
VLLAFASGTTDVFGLLALSGVFTSAITGNTALLGIAIGQGQFGAALRSFAALAGFLTGVAAGALPRDTGRRTALFRILAIEVLCLGSCAAIWGAWSDLDKSMAVYGLILLSAAGMGVQSAAARRMNLPGISTVAFTNTLTSIVIAATGAVLRRAAFPFEGLRQIAVFCAYLVGTLLAGVTASRSLGAIVLLPLIAVLGALGTEYRSKRAKRVPDFLAASPQPPGFVDSSGISNGRLPL